MKRTRAAIVGAGGYSGQELLEILLRHPHVDIVGLFGSSRNTASRSVAETMPRLRGLCDLSIEPTTMDALAATNADAVFLCTPHEASMDLAQQTLDRMPDATVFDLSAAFRLPDASLYPTWYGFAHTQTALLAEAVYGMPELSRDGFATARLVACPGCYPTASVLSLAPLVRAGAVRKGTRPIVDAISGVSGAGRTPNEKVHFCEVSLQPYNVLKHRHTPEISTHCGREVVFTPHLVALDRGIVATSHVELENGWTTDRIRALYEDAYASEPFVRFLPAEVWPSIRDVRGSNRCDIGVAVDEAHQHAIVVSAIDNLIKGASGQAAQCMNIRFGYDETAGFAGTTLPIATAMPRARHPGAGAGAGVSDG